MTEDRLIRLSEVLKVTGLQKSSLYTRIKEGAFPAPAKIGSASCWSSNEVQAWVRAQLDTRRVEPTQPDPAPPLAPGQKPFIIGYRDEPDFVWLYE